MNIPVDWRQQSESEFETKRGVNRYVVSKDPTRTKPWTVTLFSIPATDPEHREQEYGRYVDFEALEEAQRFVEQLVDHSPE
ncbi:hypothetical protein [Mycolicibacterium sp. CBMA 226]|uniref:hypothetical protein n=1 Tax=Mycolicibacterium sp. CBMA 226 TaxID=2606611 RepID=UPI0012DE868D|nr:hypothetical protein [Mycolicibacterium sp. CBMA 226]MUL75714.1 hypothetical protein [Mycolicibacterium sp. CBMA 226]